MKLLLSAYACFPNHGSEPGVGYLWLSKSLEAGYSVTLLTSGWSYDRLRSDPLVDHHLLDILVTGSSFGDGLWRRRRILYQLYLIVWQLVAALTLLIRGLRFDIAHHVTYGGVTIPSFIGFFAKKSIYGPVGGGEAAPLALARACGRGALVKEILKRGQQSLVFLDPFVWLTKIGFSEILIKNKSNLWVFWGFQKKCRVKAEIAVNTQMFEHLSFSEKGESKKIAFSGRGIYWKGGMLAVKFAEKFQEKYPNANVEFHFFGDGREFKEWEARASKGKVQRVFFHGRLSQDEYIRQFSLMDLLWFPSFHDSSGNVVLESLVLGVPVVAFDLAGPSSIIDHDDFLIDPNLQFSDMAEKFISKSNSLLMMSGSRRREISTYYLSKFSSKMLLNGVYQ
tara:strand:- start:3141 stop:4322 length:1182 start_codon:yes stop_codon:yes gene_type:complete